MARVLHSLLPILVAVGLVPVALAEEEGPGTGTGATLPAMPTLLLEGLRADHWQERAGAYGQLLRQQQAMVGELIRLAAGKEAPAVPAPLGVESGFSFHSPKHLAILLLGHLRAAEAVPVLLDNLRYKAPRSLFGGAEPPEFWHPAIDSLIRIGKPATEPTIEKLASSQDELERELCCRIIVRVEGDELAPIVVQLAIDQEEDPERKANLEAARKYLPEKKLGPPGVRFE